MHKTVSAVGAFRQAVQRWARVVKVEPSQIRIQRMRRKWASCSTKGWVCFNADLPGEPMEFQDYVIVHELLHLQIPNHGRLFTSFMNAYLPEWTVILEARKRRKPRQA